MIEELPESVKSYYEVHEWKHTCASVGVIITRCDELQEIFDSLDKGSSYGASTTHMSKLLPRIEGGGCPILVFGISKKLYIEGE